ncbi:MAG: HEAT repeat domain-containing protein [Proteobacteria bacterium]|nr:HEAT repeat domain-containing protein [Pseudomonadota bacterium]
MDPNIEREEKIKKKINELRKNFTLNEEVKKFIYDCLADESWRVRKDAVSLTIENPENEILDILINGLASEDNAGLRNACQEALTKIGERTINKLIDSFNKSDRDVRKFIIDIVGDIGKTEYCDFLISALNDNDENVVISACENLGKLRSEKAIEPLLKKLDKNNEWLSFVIIEALSQIGKPFDAEKILSLWEVNQLRKPILDMITIFDEKTAKELLAKAFCDRAFFVQENASKALFRVISLKPERLKDFQNTLEDIIVFNSNYKKLLNGKREDELIFALLTFISKDAGFFQEFMEKAGDEALEFFGSLGEYADYKNKDLIIKNIKNHEGKKEAYLVYLIGLFRIEDGIPYLKDLCNANYGHTRQAVAFSFGKLSSEEAVDCLFKLIDDKYKDVREEAVKSLSRKITKDNFPEEMALKIFESGDKDKITAILSLMGRIGYFNEKIITKALRDINPEVRAKAIKLISEFRLKDFLNDVLLLLTDENEEVRYEAILCTGNIIEDEEMAELLVPFLDDESNNIKKATIRSIYNISKDLLKKFEDIIFKNISPIIYLYLIELLREGMSFDIEKMFKIAENFDDYDIYRELISSLIEKGDTESARQILKRLESEKGFKGLLDEFSHLLEESF